LAFVEWRLDISVACVESAGFGDQTTRAGEMNITIR